MACVFFSSFSSIFFFFIPSSNWLSMIYSTDDMDYHCFIVEISLLYKPSFPKTLQWLTLFVAHEKGFIVRIHHTLESHRVMFCNILYYEKKTVIRESKMCHWQESYNVTSIEKIIFLCFCSMVLKYRLWCCFLHRVCVSHTLQRQ